MKVFVTGGSGFIGRALVERLSTEERGYDKVYLLMRRPSSPVAPPFEIVQGDLESLASFREIILQCDYVFHLAANAAFGDDADYNAVNFTPTAILVDILKESTVLKNFVFTSTIGAVDRMPGDHCRNPLSVECVPNPRSRYGESKLRAERYIQNSGIPFTIIRPAWVYGRDMRAGSHINRFVSMIHEGHPAARVAFPGRVSLIHVNDLTHALLRCIGNQTVIGRTYFAETETISIKDIFSTIAKKLRGTGMIQVPMPFLSPIISRLHARLPPMVAVLFVDYLCAGDDQFRRDIPTPSPTLFVDGIEDVIRTNVRIHGSWVITGANSGIGHALATKLYEAGKNLILIDKERDNLSGFKDAQILCADLSDESEIDRVCSALSDSRIACLVNNAGIGVRGPLRETPAESIRQIVAVNALAPVLLTRKLIENLVANEAVIVNIASSIAYNPLPYMSLYSSTKAFVSNWSESLTYELRKTNTVITFSPSGTMTGFQRSAGVRLTNGGRGLLTPEYVAEKIIEAVERRKKVVILGRLTRALLFVSKLLPRNLNITLWGKLFEKYR